MRKLLQIKLVKFGIAGGINTVVDWIVYNALLMILGDSLELNAKIAGNFAGITCAFILNSLWVFNDLFVMQLDTRTEKSSFAFIAKSYFKFCLSYSIGMMLNAGMFMILRNMEVNRHVAFVVATGFSLVFNFVVSKLILFKPKSQSV